MFIGVQIGKSQAPDQQPITVQPTALPTQIVTNPPSYQIKPVIDKNITVNEVVESPYKYLTYCKPDEDPNFKLDHEDNNYYYYTGSNTLEGSIMRYKDSEDLTFYNQNVGGACPLILTTHYEETTSSDINNEFHVSQAWNTNTNICGTLETIIGLEGWYKINIKGFKIPKSTISSYRPNVIESHKNEKMFIDYDSIVEEIKPMHIVCSATVY